MNISDEEKRQIMNDLALGNPDLSAQQPSSNFSRDDQPAVNEYQNFDDFAQRSKQGGQWQTS